MVKGGRQLFTCPSCKKRFTYWILESNPHPKVKCTYCATESFPNGEPPAAPPAPAKPSAPPAPAK
jgi:DNA-directed RNA polymerase subunit RPC12/RpoP